MLLARPTPARHEIDPRRTRDRGLAALRQSKVLRLTHEALDQGALLTQGDLARLLCTSVSTIKGDTEALRRDGFTVPTRGAMQDIGRRGPVRR